MRFLLCCFLLLFVPSSLAIESKRFIVGAQDIRYLPHFDFDDKDEKGVLWAILEAFAENANIQFEYVALPIKRLQRELVKGEVDFVFPENPKWFNQHIKGIEKTYSDPFYYVLGAAFVERQNINFGVKDITRISVPFGFSPVMWQDYVQQKKVIVVGVTDSIAALNLVLKKRAQATDLEYSVVEWLKRREPAYRNIVMSPNLPFDVVSFHMATIAHPDIIARLNTYLYTHKDDIDKLKRRYGIADAKYVASKHLNFN